MKINGRRREDSVSDINYHRVFIAIPVDKDLQGYIQQTVKNLYPNNAFLRWIQAENYHITLHYLGSVTEKQLRNIITKITPIIHGYSSFSLKLEVASGFPSIHKPRALAVLVKLSFLLNNLYEETKQAITSCDVILPPRAYTPHLAVARVKLGGWIGASKRMPNPLKIPTQTLNIYQSLADESITKFRIINSIELSRCTIEA